MVSALRTLCLSFSNVTFTGVGGYDNSAEEQFAQQIGLLEQVRIMNKLS